LVECRPPPSIQDRETPVMDAMQSRHPFGLLMHTVILRDNAFTAHDRMNHHAAPNLGIKIG